MKLLTLQQIQKALTSVKSLISEVLTNTVEALTELETKIPSKVSELENDSGYLTSSTADTTYSLKKQGATITLVGSDASEDSETFTKADIGLGNVPNVTTNNQKPTFSQAATRANIASGETLTTILGKIMKWYADLKNVAFTGNYSDLSGKPAIPTVPSSLKNPRSLTFTGGVSLDYDGSVARSVAIPTTLPANGGNANTVGGKNAATLQDYNNLSNKPLTLQSNTLQSAYPIVFTNGNEFSLYSTLIYTDGSGSGYLYNTLGIKSSLTYQQVFDKLPNMSIAIISSENKNHTYGNSLPCPNTYCEAIYDKSYGRGTIILHSLDNNKMYYTVYVGKAWKGWKEISGVATTSTFSAVPSTDQLWVDENGQFVRKYVDGAWQDIAVTNNEEENL